MAEKLKNASRIARECEREKDMTDLEIEDEIEREEIARFHNENERNEFNVFTGKRN